MKKVYISSTYIDLKDHRSAVAHALRKMGSEVRCMEDYVATDQRTDARCKQDVAECDFYVGIIALRYGWIPPGSDVSITELEYRQARDQPNKTRCLMFLLDERAEWPVQWIDALHDPQSAARLVTFRGSLDGESTGRFSNLEELVREIMSAVYMEDLKTWKMSLKREFEETLKHCRVRPVQSPDQFGNSPYKIALNNSDMQQIAEVLNAAIRNDTKLISIDLGRAGGWWSTRLLLLAGLVSEYTSVEKLVFFHNGKLLGTCGPHQVRHALGAEIPTIEHALAESIPEQRNQADPTHDIENIGQMFTEKLNSMDGEEIIITSRRLRVSQIENHIIRSFPGFNDDRVKHTSDVDEVQLLQAILDKTYSYVPLEGPAETVIIDQVRLASRISQLAIARV
jgi:hypothetical protein